MEITKNVFWSTMVKQIKFRVWDSKNKKMRKVECIKFNWDGVPLKINGCIDEECKSENLMQFTGLLDRSGKDIYEADIVDVWSSGSHCTGVIVWSVPTASFFIQVPPPECIWHLSGGGDEDNEETFEVIGNIYKNPELITKETV